VDPFALVLFGGLAVFLLMAWLLGRLYPGSGLEQIGQRSAREISETREELDAQDLEQMVAARNRRRSARGEAVVSADEVELEVAREQGEQARRRQPYLDEQARRRQASDEEQELAQLLEATNARRRARGLPPRTAEEARAELGVPRPPAAPES